MIIPISPTESSRPSRPASFLAQHSFVMGKRIPVVLRFLVKGAKSIQDVVPSNDIARSTDAQILSRFYRADIGRPGGQDGTLLVQREIIVANDIHWMRKRTCRMQKSVEIEDASLFLSFFPSWPFLRMVREVVRLTGHLNPLMVEVVFMRLWNARWCGLCRPCQWRCRSQSRCDAASLPQVVRAPVRSEASLRRVTRFSQLRSRQD